MSDDSIREFLASLPSDPTGQPDGHVAIFKHTIEELGGDLHEVEAWMHRHGAVTRAAPVPDRLRTGPRPEFRPYYCVPVTALSGDT